MRNFNFKRFLYFIVIVFLVNNVAKALSMVFGASKEMADNISLLAMLITAIFLYQKMARNRRDKQP